MQNQTKVTRYVDGMKLVRYRDEEWSALYINGELDTVGDSYLSDDRISELLDITEISDNAFLQGGDSYEDVAKTLEEVEAYSLKQNEAEEILAEAEVLQLKAEELLRQAAELRKRG